MEESRSIMALSRRSGLPRSRELHSSLVEQRWRDRGSPLRRERAIIDLDSSIVAEGHAGYRRCREAVFRNIRGMKILVIQSRAYRVNRVGMPVCSDQAGVLIDVANEIAGERPGQIARLNEPLLLV